MGMDRQDIIVSRIMSRIGYRVNIGGGLPTDIANDISGGNYKSWRCSYCQTSSQINRQNDLELIRCHNCHRLHFFNQWKGKP